jgi:hypothetical protein
VTKCWNCNVEIERAENWTPENRIWIETNLSRPHDFKKCYREKLIREGKWKQHSREAEDEPEVLSEPFITTDEIREWGFVVYCYYCKFKTRIQNAYEIHTLREHPSSLTVKKLCYPGLVDLKLLSLKPQGRSWEV